MSGDRFGADCDIQDYEATLTLTFKGCAEHREFLLTHGEVHMEGFIHVQQFASGVLGVLEETLTKRFGDYPPLKELIEADWADIGVLDEDAKEYAVKLFVNRFLTDMVSERTYETDSISMLLELPHLS